MRKIGILTQPLHDNYGGLLQSYALKQVLQSLGHEVTVINRRSKNIAEWKKALAIIKRKIMRQHINPKIYLTNEQKRIISQQTDAFRQKYIPNLSDLITDDQGMGELSSMGFDAYVVGSDQCWRPKYSPKITNYFLDFASQEIGIKRISYAASFGVSEWEYDTESTRVCAQLLEKFDAISVREESGVPLVKEYLGQDACHVIDPTMLLTRDQYIEIATNEGAKQSPGKLKVYMLDKTEAKQDLIQSVEKKLGIREFQVLPKKKVSLERVGSDVADFVYPNPAQWLQGYRDADFVLTDSFHGSVFSILFNIPFLVVANKSRGIARFESLLKMFDLESRLIFDLDDFDFDSFQESKIDWDTVNAILESEREKAMDFLKTYLS